MIYLWKRPIRLVDHKVREFLGAIPATPIEVALRTTLQGLGRLNNPMSESSTAVSNEAMDDNGGPVFQHHGDFDGTSSRRSARTVEQVVDAVGDRRIVLDELVRAHMPGHSVHVP